jgi:hypothetical protein
VITSYPRVRFSRSRVTCAMIPSDTVCTRDWTRASTRTRTGCVASRCRGGLGDSLLPPLPVDRENEERQEAGDLPRRTGARQRNSPPPPALRPGPSKRQRRGAGGRKDRHHELLCPPSGGGLVFSFSSSSSSLDAAGESERRSRPGGGFGAHAAPARPRRQPDPAVRVVVERVRVLPGGPVVSVLPTSSFAAVAAAAAAAAAVAVAFASSLVQGVHGGRAGRPRARSVREPDPAGVAEVRPGPLQAGQRAELLPRPVRPAPVPRVPPLPGPAQAPQAGREPAAGGTSPSLLPGGRGRRGARGKRDLRGGEPIRGFGQ